MIKSNLPDLLDRAFEAKRGDKTLSLLQHFGIQVQQAYQLQQLFVLQFPSDSPTDAKTLFCHGENSDSRAPKLAEFLQSQSEESEAGLRIDEGEQRIEATQSSISETLMLMLAWSDPPNGRFHSEAEDVSDLLADLRRREIAEEYSRLEREQQILRRLEHSLNHANSRDDVFNILCCDLPGFVGADRVSVAQRSILGRWSIRCATGAATVDERSDAVRALVRKIEDAEKRDKQQSIDSDFSALAFPISATCDWENAQYAIVVEFRDLREARPLVKAVSGTVWSALPQNSDRRTKTNRYFSGFSLLRSWKFRLVVLTLICVGILSFVNVDFAIPASGTVAPKIRRHIFARESGTIYELSAEEGKTVTGSTVLCRIQNEELLAEQESLQGELSAFSARLATIESNRVGGSRFEDSLAAEVAELRLKVVALRKQLDLNKQRIDHLTVTAEINGVVYGEGLREKLLQRPIDRGQRLFDIADPSAEWELSLNVAEQDLQYLPSTNGEAGVFSIRYSTSNAPTRILNSVIGEVASGSAVVSDGQTGVRVISVVQESDVPFLRPWATVQARIFCGRKSLGEAVFYRARDAVQRFLLLRF